MNSSYALVLTGMDPATDTADEVQDGIYFVIGPENQFTPWEEYLNSVEGDDVILYCLYPRDFWM